MTVAKRALTEIETAEYIGMSRSFLRQSRMEGNRDNRTKAPIVIPHKFLTLVSTSFLKKQFQLFF